jgi:hypothetical protein
MSRPFRGALASVAVLASACAVAQGQSVKTLAAPSVRITEQVTTAKMSRLTGTHPSVVDSATIGSRLSSSTPLQHMKLVLTSSDEQLAALHLLADQQQDKSSPNFHKWLTPDTFGQYFGAAPADVQKVTSWLTEQGFTVEEVAKSNRVITFSGSVAQVETAFQTEMHTVQVNGESHIANTTDLAVPSALSSVVLGIARLNNFFPTSGARRAGKTMMAEHIPADSLILAGTTPLYGSSPTGTHYVAPGDAANIYNTTPLLTAGYDGSGQTVAVLARSNVTVSDVQQFRSLFGLKKNDPTITVVGNDPGQNADDVEAYLDIEWAGAMAPGANVNFLVGGASLVSEGIDTAGLYAVNNNIGDIITLSYGGCESGDGASGTAFWNSLWEQAAAQGQTAFVSSGDSGAATCDSSSATYATGGYAVNALGSSAYNVAVGGSMFVDFGPAQYWGTATGTPYTSALGYIPEAPLDQSRVATTYLNSASTAYAAGTGVFSAGGGISIYTPRPSWQTGSGISATADPAAMSGTGIASGSPITGPHRLVPDIVNISASGHDATLICYDSICYTSSTATLGNAGLVGGTSVATPVQASIQALINQRNGGRQGNINYYLYKLAAAQYNSSTTACQVPLGTPTSTTVTLPAASCNFHDIITGNNAVPTAATGTASIGFAAGVGFDAASGLGSMNVTNVANNWASVAFTGTTTTFTLTPASGVKHGASQTVAITVAPTAGTGIPTGDVSLIAETTLPNGPFAFTLGSAGTVTGTFTGLPAGSYKVHAHYAGDGTYGASDSPSIPVVISAESSTITEQPYLVTAAGSVTAANSFAFNSEVYIDTNVAGASGTGVATGTVIYTVTRNGSALPSLTTNLDTYGNTFFVAGVSFTNFYIKANYPALSPGTYVVTANYSGDSNFSASTTSTTFVVTQATPAVTFTAPSSITSGASTVPPRASRRAEPTSLLRSTRVMSTTLQRPPA